MRHIRSSLIAMSTLLSLSWMAQAQTTPTAPPVAQPPAKPPVVGAAQAPGAAAKPKATAPRPRTAPTAPVARTEPTGRAEVVTSAQVEERLRRIELALSSSGIESPEPVRLSGENQAKKRELEERQASIGRQLAVLEQAVKNGLDAEAARPSLEKLQGEMTQVKKEIWVLDNGAEPAKETLPQRLGRIETELRATKAATEASAPERREVSVAPPAVAASASESEKKAQKPLAGYEEKFFLRSSDDRFTLALGGHFQARLAWTRYADELDKDSEVAFLIPRSRLGISGNAYGPNVGYNLLLDFGKGTTTLLDSWIEFHAVKDLLSIRVGQMKKPFSRQQLTSSSAYQFVDPASTDKNFGAGYDIGLMLHDRFDKSPAFEWALGIFNGSGSKSTFTGGAVTGTASTDDEGNTTVTGTVSETASFSNVPKRLRPTLVGRVGYNTPKLKGYSESDLEGGAPRFGIAGSVQREFDFDDNDVSNLRGEGDAIVKAFGFSTTGGLYFGWLENRALYEDSDLHYEGLGWHLQAGYVVEKLVEPVLRWEGYLKDGPWNNVQTLLVGANWFLSGHKLKVSAEIGPQFDQWTNPDDATDHQHVVTVVGRTQAQLAF